eukprot:TRINITY_DN2895_c0_g1_i1.p1 TRINITY_DN2895_c0_g1~~TRINITY_DN2895_c0_g1_i1.p1  ORF type:complete len:123 (-),score=14.85 TRINITY_DN2895_c0_g1_i1:103-423(-)
MGICFSSDDCHSHCHYERPAYYGRDNYQRINPYVQNPSFTAAPSAPPSSNPPPYNPYANSNNGNFNQRPSNPPPVYGVQPPYAAPSSTYVVSYGNPYSSSHCHHHC